MRRGLLIGIAMSVATSIPSFAETIHKYIIPRVIDGDSAIVQDVDTKEEIEIRFSAIQAPDKGMDFYRESGDYVRHRVNELQNVQGRLFEIERSTHQDPYGRTIATIRPEGSAISLNEEVARQGLALVYPDEDTLSETIRQAIAEAKEEHKGIWSICEDAAAIGNRRSGVMHTRDCYYGRRIHSHNMQCISNPNNYPGMKRGDCFKKREGFKPNPRMYRLAHYKRH